MGEITLDKARAAKGSAIKVFGRLVDVVGVGITRIDGRYALKVNVRAAPLPGVKLPRRVRGVPVRVEVVGPIRKR